VLCAPLGVPLSRLCVYNIKHRKNKHPITPKLIIFSLYGSSITLRHTKLKAEFTEFPKKNLSHSSIWWICNAISTNWFISVINEHQAWWVVKFKVGNTYELFFGFSVVQCLWVLWKKNSFLLSHVVWRALNSNYKYIFYCALVNSAYFLTQIPTRLKRYAKLWRKFWKICIAKLEYTIQLFAFQ
jgi:hypothetical protein